MAEAALVKNKNTTGSWTEHWGSDCRATQLVAEIAVNPGWTYDKTTVQGMEAFAIQAWSLSSIPGTYLNVEEKNRLNDVFSKMIII